MLRLDESGTGYLKEVTTQTQHIAVGDIIRIRDDEIIPADCVVLASYSNEGQCYTKT